MKFTINKSLLLREITIAQEIIQARNATSITSNVLLTIEYGKLYIKATDLKTNYQTSVSCMAIGNGTTAVFCDKLLNVVKNMPECEIEFVKKDSSLSIKPIGQKIDFKLRCMDHSNFPEFPEPTINFFNISQHDFSNMVNNTMFAVSDDETRYFLNGVYFCDEGMVATDGRRLSFSGISSPVTDGVIIPTKVLSLVKKLMFEGNLQIAIDNGIIFFKMDNMVVSSTLIDGKFPQYGKITGENPSYKAVCLRNNLQGAVRRISTLADYKSRRILITVSEGKISITSEENEIGTAKEEIPCSYSGPTITIAINYSYLVDPLKAIETDEVQFCFTDSSRPVMIYSEPRGNSLHMIQPMQVE